MISTLNYYDFAGCWEGRNRRSGGKRDSRVANSPSWRAPVPAGHGYGVVRVQAFGVHDADMKTIEFRLCRKGAMQAASGVLTEHQVLPIGQGKRLLVCALYGG